MHKLQIPSHCNPLHCIILFVLLALAPGTPCRAHEDKHTHPALSVGAMLFLDLTHPEDGVFIPQFGRTNIRKGSIDEDQCPNYVSHFYDPKTGQNTTLLP